MDPTLWPTGSCLGVSAGDLAVNKEGYFNNARGGGSAYTLRVGYSGLGYIKAP